MNKKNIDDLIKRYDQEYYMINDSEHEERFKWEAMKGFRDVWFSEEAKNLPFAEKFDRAMKKSSVMINNSTTSPTTGIIKMAEQRPEEIEKLFTELLFAPYASIDELQDHMDTFIDKTEEIRKELFPQFYRYKQDRHAVSCYLAFWKPEEHFVYRYSDAEEFSLHAEYGKDLGSGANFSLANYYEMAEIIVEALKEHKSLLEKYDALFKDNETYYYDESLHLLAFDLMYCCRCYNFYGKMEHMNKKESIEAYTAQQIKEKEEQERQEQIDALNERLHAIDVEMDGYREISLIGVDVTQAAKGKGTVIEQEGSKIKVRFDDGVTSYVINAKYAMRPRFADDEEVVAAFTAYDALLAEKKALEEKLKKLQK
jgi:hypothetical protein